MSQCAPEAHDRLRRDVLCRDGSVRPTATRSRACSKTSSRRFDGSLRHRARCRAHRCRRARARPGRERPPGLARSTTSTLVRAVNAQLPEAIRSAAGPRRCLAFHARFSATCQDLPVSHLATRVLIPSSGLRVACPGPLLDVMAMRRRRGTAWAATISRRFGAWAAVAGQLRTMTRAEVLGSGTPAAPTVGSRRRRHAGRARGDGFLQAHGACDGRHAGRGWARPAHAASRWRRSCRIAFEAGATAPPHGPVPGARGL